MRIYGIIGLAALSVCLLTLSACGGDDDSKATATKAAAATTSTTGTDATKAATTAATTAASSAATSGSGGVTGSGAAALKSLAGDAANKTYQASYDVVSVRNGKTTNISMTTARKPPKTFTSFQTGTTGATTIIFDGTSTISCINAAGNRCFRSKSGAGAIGDALSGTFSLEQTLKDLGESVDVSETGGQNIAGQDSRCFLIKRTGGAGGDETACFSKNGGIVTLVDTKDANGNTTQIKATKVSTSVDDSVFAPPAGATIVDQP